MQQSRGLSRNQVHLIAKQEEEATAPFHAERPDFSSDNVGLIVSRVVDANTVDQLAGFPENVTCLYYYIICYPHYLSDLRTDSDVFVLIVGSTPSFRTPSEHSNLSLGQRPGQGLGFLC
jgi:hypothetical protein